MSEARLLVLPLYAQVYIGSEGTVDLPDDDGDFDDLGIRFTPHSVFVATRSDDLGRVEMTARLDEETDLGDLITIFEGHLVIDGRNLEFGSIIADTFGYLDVGGPRRIGVRIAVDEVDTASRVLVLCTSTPQ